MQDRKNALKLQGCQVQLKMSADRRNVEGKEDCDTTLQSKA